MAARDAAGRCMGLLALIAGMVSYLRHAISNQARLTAGSSGVCREVTVLLPGYQTCIWTPSLGSVK